MSDLELFDPFETEEAGKYDQDKFYVKDLENEKMGERQQIRLPAGVYRRMNVLVASGKIPAYGTNADIIRDAVYHRLHHVANLIGDPVLKDYMERATEASGIAMLLESRKERRDTYEKSKMLVDGAIEDRDIHFARDVIKRLERMAELESGPIVDRYEAEASRLRRAMANF